MSFIFVNLGEKIASSNEKDIILRVASGLILWSHYYPYFKRVGKDLDVTKQLVKVPKVSHSFCKQQQC